MNQKLLKELKKKLEKEKAQVKRELEKFAKESERRKGSWDIRFPKFNGGESGSGALEKAADEVEEYSTLLPIKYNLELKLNEINLALEKIKHPRRGHLKYGICEKCGKEIEEKRLKICPETRYCLKCKPR